MTIVWKLKWEFYTLDSQSVAWQMFIQNSFCPLTEIRPQVLSLVQDLNSIESVYQVRYSLIIAYVVVFS